MLKRIVIVTNLLIASGLNLLGQSTVPIQSVKADSKVVAFTFDDGPNAKITRRLMELFEQEDGKATFFNMGKNLSSAKEAAEELIRRGHEIGNHTMNHKCLPALEENEEVWKEINGFQELYKKELNYQPVLFRAPFLKYGLEAEKAISKLGLQAVNGSVFAKDAKKNVDPQEIIRRIEEGIHPGGIILCHERKHTVEALKILLPKLKEQGYKFVTVSALLARNNEEGKIAANHPLIRIAGSNYARMEGQVMVFPRHSRELLTMSKAKSKFNPKKAQTTTGVILSFKTSSPKVKLSFKVLEGDNRGPVFGIFQDKKFMKAVKFGRQDGPELKFEVESAKPGEKVLYEITLPNWSNVAFMGLELEKGYKLIEMQSEKKPVYVAYGNSITHGTGQVGTFQTYPFIVSRNMDWDLYNVAVGGGKT
jgi:peptidoglycan/xylan/chitin deacetylase (PgdA/CDA1 family)